MRHALIAIVASTCVSLAFWMVVGGGLQSESKSESRVVGLGGLRQRVEALERKADSAGVRLRGAEEPVAHVVDSSLGEQVEQLALRIAALEEVTHSQQESPRSPPPRPQLDGDARAVHKAEVDDALEQIAALPREDRLRRLQEIATRERETHWYESEERVLRRIIDEAGRGTSIGREAAYQIGWARANRHDHEGARSAWLEAAGLYPPDHWRRAHALFNAANSAVKLNRPQLARTEFSLLLHDFDGLELQGGPSLDALLTRARNTLASLDK